MAAQQPADLFSLRGQMAMVTGGAQGLGKAMATALATYGADIALMDLNLPLAEASAAEISTATGARCLAIRGDVTNPVDVQAAVDAIVQACGRLDVLVNNAGIVINIPAEEMSLLDWQRVIDINLTGVFLCAQAAGRQMIRQGGGRIINIASMSGIVSNTPQPQVSYNASKAGVIMLTKSLAGEWARHNIRVNAIAPGYMRTALTAAAFERPETYEQWLVPTPMKRPGEPAELGGAVVYLASEASSFVTGHVLVVDGGYTVW